MKFYSSILLSIALFVTNISTSDIQFPDIQKIKGDYKNEISDAIFKEKAIRCLAVGIPTAMILASWLANRNSVTPPLIPTTGDLTESEIKGIRELLAKESLNVKTLDSNLKGLELIKAKFQRVGNTLMSATKSLISSLPLIIGQLYLDPILRWLILYCDIKWVTNRYDVSRILSDLKFNAVYLDPKSPILTIDNKIVFTNSPDRSVVIQFPGTYFDEIIRLKIVGQSFLSMNQNEFDKDKQIKNVEQLSNKFVNAISKVIAYLYYNAEALSKKQDSTEKAAEYEKYADLLLKLTQEYCSSIKNALEKYSNETDDKGLITTIYYFENLFNQIVNNFAIKV